jgi:hypothetical protein
LARHAECKSRASRKRGLWITIQILLGHRSLKTTARYLPCFRAACAGNRQFLRRFLLHVLPASFVAFATSACSPIASVPNCSICAVLICSARPRRRLRWAWGISVNTVIAALCERWKYFLLTNFLPGSRIPRWRTLHDSHLPCPGIPITLQPALALADTPVCAILPIVATSVFTSWHNRLSGKIRHDFFFPVIPVQSSPQPPCSTRSPPHTISKTHSTHIVPSGGFAQPTLSLVLRREDLRNPSQHVSLSTSDRVLVGSRQS